MADAGTAALAYASFSVMMTAGRFGGDWLNEKLGKTALVVGGSALSFVGLLLVIVFANAWLAIVGFSLIGLGVSNIVPIAFTAAGNVTEIPTGSAIAAVALIGYFGLLAGPPIIGFTAEMITLRFALLLVGVLLATMIVMAKWVKREVRINDSDAVDEIK
jgi:MFS family permease